jgi:hypothetical protein
LSAKPEDLSWVDIERIVAGNLTEYQELEFKAEHYKSSDEFAKDIVAMANTSGGIIMIGIGESPTMIISNVACNQGEKDRYIQILASLVYPRLSIEIKMILNPEEDAKGVFIISVLKSPIAPHAVKKGNALTYPWRNDSTTEYYQEKDITILYLDRFSRFAQREELRERILKEAVKGSPYAAVPTYLPENYLKFILTLSPDFSGEYKVDTKNLHILEKEEGATTDWFETWKYISHGTRVFAGRQMFYISDLLGGGQLQLYTSGSGAYSFDIVPERVEPGFGELPINMVTQQSLLLCLVEGLIRLGRHANRTGCLGMVNLGLYLEGINTSFPVALSVDLAGRSTPQKSITSFEKIDLWVDLADILSFDTNLLQVAYKLLQEIVQTFSVLNNAYLLENGSLRISAIPSGDGVKVKLQNLCDKSGISQV